MTKRNVLKWLSAGWTAIVDPEKETRVSDFAKKVHRRLADERDAFDFQTVCETLEVPESDIPQIRERVYRTCVERAWSDMELTEKESRSLAWVSSKLILNEESRARVDRDFGSELVTKLLATYMTDGTIDENEYQKISEIARWMKIEPTEIMRNALGKQGSGLVRSLFLSAINDGELSQQEWESLKSQAMRFGLSAKEFQSAISHHAHDFVESAFVNARMDGILSDEEDRQIHWLLTNLISDPSHQVYFSAELRQMRQLTKIARGSLPSLQCPRELTLKGGEILHAYCGARMEYVRHLKSGSQRETIVGDLAVTDERILLIGQPKSIDLSYRFIVACHVQEQFTTLRCSNKGLGSGTYHFESSPLINGSILDCAIRRAKRTVTDQSDDIRTRHIPRDVRQRVWVKYGGRCAECNADQYLEFDHIVPHSRGGSNTKQNVQLLCRGCNLKKLDAI